jgi:hypothetical protein
MKTGSPRTSRLSSGIVVASAAKPLATAVPLTPLVPYHLPIGRQDILTITAFLVPAPALYHMEQGLPQHSQVRRRTRAMVSLRLSVVSFSCCPWWFRIHDPVRNSGAPSSHLSLKVK